MDLSLTKQKSCLNLLEYYKFTCNKFMKYLDTKEKINDSDSCN